MDDTLKTKPTSTLQTCLHIKENVIIAFTTLNFTLTLHLFLSDYYATVHDFGSNSCTSTAPNPATYVSILLEFTVPDLRTYPPLSLS